MARIVSQETRRRMSRAQLSLRQQKFIREYVANNGNGTAAARAVTGREWVKDRYPDLGSI